MKNIILPTVAVNSGIFIIKYKLNEPKMCSTSIFFLAYGHLLSAETTFISLQKYPKYYLLVNKLWS